MTIDVAPHTTGGSREWLGLAVLTLRTLLVSMNATVIYLAAPMRSAAKESKQTIQIS
jgi:hypothetical protein